jgi:signal transduction histidine kinase
MNRSSEIRLIGAQRIDENSSAVGTKRVTWFRSGRTGRHGLFRKYLLLFIGLICAALLLNAGIEVIFNYRETQAILERLQREKADAAAQRIAQFVGEIERQIGWTTQGQWAASSIDQRRFDYVRLLRQVPAITELRQIDATGKEQLKVSRLAMDVVASGADFSQDVLFTDALAHKISFSPVYFRNESEPYLTIAIAGSGRNPGVTLADVNLKLIWDVIRELKVGRNGYAFVVDRQGRLIAHPDISLVLRNISLATLPQVAAGLREMSGATSDASVAGPDINSAGERVLSAHAALPPLGWLVFVELPTAEAFAPLYESVVRTGAVLLSGLALAALAAFFLVRRMVGPIRQLQAGAALIGAGNLDSRINVETGDELESLADQFNIMAGQLQQSYAGLERKVAERTQELHASLTYQTAISDVLKVMSRSTTNLAPVLQKVVEMAMELCHASQASIFELEDGTYRWTVGHGINTAYRDRETRTQIAGGPDTLVGRVATTGRAVCIADVMADPDYGPKDEARTGGMRSMLGVPLLREGVTVGVIAMARGVVEPFSDREVEMLIVFADQAVIAIENVRLFREIEEKSRQLTIASAHKSQFLANMSHELRTPLNAILGYTELLVDGIYGELAGRPREVLERVQVNGRNLLALINDVLDLSKIETGLVTLTVELYSIGALAQGVMSAMEPLAHAKGIALVTQIDEAAPPGTGDARRLQQVLVNLVGNAIKFTDAGQVEVTTEAKDGRFRIAVRDTGPGIAPEDQETIFEEFHQVDNSSTRVKGGTGLGLAISRRIVELHRGHLFVQSTVGDGSIFVVDLPQRTETGVGDTP